MSVMSPHMAKSNQIIWPQSSKTRKKKEKKIKEPVKNTEHKSK